MPKDVWLAFWVGPQNHLKSHTVSWMNEQVLLIFSKVHCMLHVGMFYYSKQVHFFSPQIKTPLHLFVRFGRNSLEWLKQECHILNVYEHFCWLKWNESWEIQTVSKFSFTYGIIIHLFFVQINSTNIFIWESVLHLILFFSNFLVFFWWYSVEKISRFRCIFAQAIFFHTFFFFLLSFRRIWMSKWNERSKNYENHAKREMSPVDLTNARRRLKCVVYLQERKNNRVSNIRCCGTVPFGVRSLANSVRFLGPHTTHTENNFHCARMVSDVLFTHASGSCERHMSPQTANFYYHIIFFFIQKKKWFVDCKS